MLRPPRSMLVVLAVLSGAALGWGAGAWSAERDAFERERRAQARVRREQAERSGLGGSGQPGCGDAQAGLQLEVKLEQCTEALAILEQALEYAKRSAAVVQPASDDEEVGDHGPKAPRGGPAAREFGPTAPAATAAAEATQRLEAELRAQFE